MPTETDTIQPGSEEWREQSLSSDESFTAEVDHLSTPEQQKSFFKKNGVPDNPDDDPRDRPQMMWDLEAAYREISTEISQLDSSDDAEKTLFPEMIEKHGLRTLEFVDPGTPDAGISLQINPGAIIKLDEDDTLRLFDAQGDSKDWDVTFETQKIGGFDVGKKMTADRIGPGHPKGTAPSDQADLLACLPTDGAANQRYVRGHLLNDNLGGPGKAPNLFPITGQANKDHLTTVETQVKDWVNTMGYMVHYEVLATKTKAKLDAADRHQNFVDGTFKCLAYPIDAEGNQAKGAPRISAVISSTHGHKVAPTAGPGNGEKGDGKDIDTSQRDIVDAGNVKLPDHKLRNKYNPQDWDPTITNAFGSFLDHLDFINDNQEDPGFIEHADQLVAEFFTNISNIFKHRVKKDDAFEMLQKITSGKLMVNQAGQRFRTALAKNWSHVETRWKAVHQELAVLSDLGQAVLGTVSADDVSPQLLADLSGDIFGNEPVKTALLKINSKKRARPPEMTSDDDEKSSH